MARGWMWGALALTIACKGGGADDVAEPTDDTDDTDTTTPDTTALTAPLPGFGSIDGASIEVVGSRADGLNVPRDLEFNPAVPGELWVVNRADDSTTIFHGMGTPDQSSEHRIDPFALHFMEEVSSLSFGAATFDGSDAPTWGSCQESRNTYNGQSSPNDFMGPSLWTADLDIFAYSNPEAVDYLTEEFGFPADLGSHLDMLHEPAAS